MIPASFPPSAQQQSAYSAKATDTSETLFQALPSYDQLDNYWLNYFKEVDIAVEENFWGNLAILKKTESYGDPYIAQLKEMGISLENDNEQPIQFYKAISWVMQQINDLTNKGVLKKEDVILPAKAFVTKDLSGSPKYHFIPLGQPVPAYAEVLNLLSPDVFVRMLAEGYFPIGEPIREHTNQTLAEHDLAHMAGFISNPDFMRSIREAFRRVQIKMEDNPRINDALKHFDSLYSLRLYYMIEIFTEIPKTKREELQKLIEIPLDIPISSANETIKKHLYSKTPAELTKYLAKIYEKFHQLVNALGGESRDMLNRRRKFRRGNTMGSFYDDVSKFSSKFDHNSIFALFLNAKAALENKRSNHSDYNKAIENIHTPLIGALIGTSQLDIEDWVLQAVEELPNPESKLYRYLHNSHFWENRDIIMLCHIHPEYDVILNSEAQIDQMANVM